MPLQNITLEESIGLQTGGIAKTPNKKSKKNKAAILTPFDPKTIWRSYGVFVSTFSFLFFFLSIKKESQRFLF